MPFPTFWNGNGNEKIIPNFREREWEAGIPGNVREPEFPLTPGGGSEGVLAKGHTFSRFFWNPSLNNCIEVHTKKLF